MSVLDAIQTGLSGLRAAKTSISTAGHNIANANREGYSRQRVELETNPAVKPIGNRGMIGRGVLVDDISRVNDEYLEKQLSENYRKKTNLEEKEFLLKHVEDIFNEMNGDGLNRLVAKFFNQFRSLANEPDSTATRQSVREASKAMIADFKRVRKQLVEQRKNVDARLSGYVDQVNSLAEELNAVDTRIKELSGLGERPNDLMDRRESILRELSGFLDIHFHPDGQGGISVDLPRVGPIIGSGIVEKFSVARTPAGEKGKAENTLDLYVTSGTGTITHRVEGGKIGALIEVRDEILADSIRKLDELAFTVSNAVNRVHRQGFSREGVPGVDYFKQPAEVSRAGELFDLSDSVKESVNNIATAAAIDAPGDNRIAIAIGSLQGALLFNGGNTSADDYYNSMVGSIGIVANKAREGVRQQSEIFNQLNNLRQQVSGVSVDEEAANLVQFQHTYDASAKVISVSNHMLDELMKLMS